MTVGELKKALEGVPDEKEVLFVDKEFFIDTIGSVDPYYDGEAVVLWSGSLKTYDRREEPPQ